MEFNIKTPLISSSTTHTTSSSSNGHYHTHSSASSSNNAHANISFNGGNNIAAGIAGVASMLSPKSGMFEAFVSLFSGGRLFAVTDKPYYVPGELITGRIVAELSAPITASGIDLGVVGYEKTEWHSKHMLPVSHDHHAGHQQQHHHHGPTPSKYVRHRAKKVFFNSKLRIYNIQGGVMMPGSHTFPFSYQLPDGLPGSFYERKKLESVVAGSHFEEHSHHGAIKDESFYDSDDEEAVGSSAGSKKTHKHHGVERHRSAMLAVVMYKLNVTLDVQGFFHPDLHARIPLVLHPKLSAESIAPATARMSSQVTVCCCLNKGSAELEAHFDKNAYVRGETAHITANVDNQSTQGLSMVVKLIRTLVLRDAQGQTHREVQVVAEQRYEEVPPHQRITRDMPLPLSADAIRPSTQSQFIDCSYQYTVEGQISMGSDIVLRMPVTIYAAQPRPIGV